MAVRLHKPDFLMLIMALLLSGIGLVTIFVIGPTRALTLSNLTGNQIGENYFFVHQAVGMMLAVAGFVIAYLLPFGFWKNSAKLILGLGLAMSAFLAVAGLAGWGVAECTNGACRWIDLGVTTIQPAEVLKLGLVLYLGVLLGSHNEEESNSWVVFRPLLIVSILTLFFVGFAQRDLGTAMTIVAILVAALVASKVRTKFLVLICAGMVVFGALATLAMPHRRQRLMTWLGMDSSSGQDESCDASCYHAEQALIAIGSGGLTGAGLGNAFSAAGYLPESINDSVFAVLGEVFGFLGLLGLLGLFFVFLLRILRTSSLLEDDTKRIVAIGFFGWILGHIVINSASMLGLIPLTGVTLPFISYGSTSLLLIFVAFGIIYKESKETARV